MVAIAENVVGTLIATDDDKSLVETAVEHIKISLIVGGERLGGLLCLVGQREHLLHLRIGFVDKRRCLLLSHLPTYLLCIDANSSKDDCYYE